MPENFVNKKNGMGTILMRTYLSYILKLSLHIKNVFIQIVRFGYISIRRI